MNAKRALLRSGRPAAVAAVALVAAGCGPAHRTDSAPPAPSASATPGRASVEVPGISLRITGATVRLDAAGDGSLAMRVAVGSGAPDHLGMIATYDGGRAVLKGGRGADGAMTSAGILVQPDSTVDFGAKDGPAAQLHGVRGAVTGHTLPLVLEFGVAGVVRLEARVTDGG
jgi:hypothetical protein